LKKKTLNNDRLERILEEQMVETIIYMFNSAFYFHSFKTFISHFSQEKRCLAETALNSYDVRQQLQVPVTIFLTVHCLTFSQTLELTVATEGDQKPTIRTGDKILGLSL
jgi:hypothetical protein